MCYDSCLSLVSPYLLPLPQCLSHPVCMTEPTQVCWGHRRSTSCNPFHNQNPYLYAALPDCSLCSGSLHFKLFPLHLKFSCCLFFHHLTLTLSLVPCNPISSGSCPLSLQPCFPVLDPALSSSTDSALDLLPLPKPASPPGSKLLAQASPPGSQLPVQA